MGCNFDPKTTIYLDPTGQRQLLQKTGGIKNPIRRELREETVLYKYTDKSFASDSYLSSGWWISRKELDQVIQFSYLNKVPEGYAVRLLCCVPPEWGNNLDRVVSVRLLRDLLAYEGLANSAIAQEEVSRTEIIARNDISAWRLPQLYIPGLRDAVTNTQTGAHEVWFTIQNTWDIKNSFTWIYHGTR